MSEQKLTQPKDKAKDGSSDRGGARGGQRQMAGARPVKKTNYGKQLAEKQKAKRLYGLRERQFRNYFDAAFKKLGNTGEFLFGLLENRLDNTVFRLGIGNTRAKAKQIVGHGHIRVNGKKVDIPSYQVKVGDIVTIKDSTLKKPIFQNLEEDLIAHRQNMVSWLTMDEKKKEGKVTGQPKLGEVEMDINWRVIIEFYSK